MGLFPTARYRSTALRRQDEDNTACVEQRSKLLPNRNRQTERISSRVGRSVQSDSPRFVTGEQVGLKVTI